MRGEVCEWVGGWGSTIIEEGKMLWDRGVAEGKQGKERTFEMEINIISRKKERKDIQTSGKGN